MAEKLQALKKNLDEGDFSFLGEIRNTVLGLSAPPQLVSAILVIPLFGERALLIYLIKIYAFSFQ